MRTLASVGDLDTAAVAAAVAAEVTSTLTLDRNLEVSTRSTEVGEKDDGRRCTLMRKKWRRSVEERQQEGEAQDES